jgi:hypothetical protein
LPDLELHGLRRDARGLGRARAVDLALDRAGKRGHKFGRLLEKGHALHVLGEIVFAPDAAQPVFGLVFGFVEQQAEAVGSEFPQKFVRVLRALHPQHLDLDPGLLEHRDGGALSRSARPRRRRR